MIKKVTAALSERVDRWTDIGLRRVTLFSVLLAVILTLTGCDNRCMCHINDTPSDRLAPVKVHIQWDERFQETPTGVTILAYTSNGCLYNAFRSNCTDYAELFLPQGEFTLVAFNQSFNELVPLWFYAYEKFENTQIILTDLENPPSFITENGEDSDNGNKDRNDNNGNGDSNNVNENNEDPEEGSVPHATLSESESKGTASFNSIAETVTEPFVYPSPWLALSEIQPVSVAPEELMNINRKCTCKVCCCSHLHDASEATHSVTLNMLPQTYTLQVNLTIHNLPAVASVKAYVSSLRRTINLRGESQNDKASILLEQWQKRMTSETDGVISSKTACLTMALTDESSLVIELSLTDGKTALVKMINMKDRVSIDHQKMTITADLELKEPLPKVEGEPAGAFWVTVTEWGDPIDIDI